MIQRCRPPWLRAPTATPAIAIATIKMTISGRVRTGTPFDLYPFLPSLFPFPFSLVPFTFYRVLAE